MGNSQYKTHIISLIISHKFALDKTVIFVVSIILYWFLILDEDAVTEYLLFFITQGNAGDTSTRL